MTNVSVIQRINGKDIQMARKFILKILLLYESKGFFSYQLLFL